MRLLVFVNVSNHLIIESSNVYGWKRPLRPSSSTVNPSPPCQPSAHVSLSAICFLNTYRNGDLTDSMGSLFQCLITLSDKKFFLIFNQPPENWVFRWDGDAFPCCIQGEPAWQQATRPQLCKRTQEGTDRTHATPKCNICSAEGGYSSHKHFQGLKNDRPAGPILGNCSHSTNSLTPTFPAALHLEKHTSLVPYLHRKHSVNLLWSLNQMQTDADSCTACIMSLNIYILFLSD